MDMISEAQKKKYRLENDAGLVVCFSNHGARITSIKFKGVEIARNGYISGRCANRIAGASFELNGKTYHLDQNEGSNHLHGGSIGFSKKYWNMKAISKSSITFCLKSLDGDMGYPGTLNIEVTYSLFSDNKLEIAFKAVSDKDTIVNPINHLFIKNKDNSLKLWINADSYTEKNSDNIPTGKIIPLKGTMYDFTEFKPLEKKKSYDINYVLNGNFFRKVASLKSEDKCIDVYTDRPGLQLYKSKDHVCLEAQLFPDAIHHQNFASPILKKDAAFYSKTAYHFKFNKE
ncbi:MAG: galactose mutarotase [Bacilli bacterium]|nr:galactose mutarotase [Bacilli bacterium]